MDKNLTSLRGKGKVVSKVVKWIGIGLISDFITLDAQCGAVAVGDVCEQSPVTALYHFANVSRSFQLSRVNQEDQECG
jgi:hypothetical protein